MADFQPPQQTYDVDSPGDLFQLNRMDKSEMARRPKPSCPSCSAKADEDKKKAEALAKKLGGQVVSVNRVDALIVHGTDTLNLGTGDHYYGLGVNALPSVGASTGFCVVTPFAGQSVDGVVSGASFGGSLSGEIVSGSVSGNGSGLMYCLGAGAGVSSPVNVDVDYNWKTSP